jgi:hypothetical protein
MVNIKTKYKFLTVLLLCSPTFSHAIEDDQEIIADVIKHYNSTPKDQRKELTLFKTKNSNSYFYKKICRCSGKHDVLCLSNLNQELELMKKNSGKDLCGNLSQDCEQDVQIISQCWFYPDKDKKEPCDKCRRGGCLTRCFKVCEELTGWDSGPGFRNCDRCDGEVITQVDEIASDGNTTRVCKGIMRSGSVKKKKK